MSKHMEPSPFRPGDLVIYTPAHPGRGLVLRTEYEFLQPGKQNRVTRIENGAYLVLRGFEESPGRGLHWSEFSASPSAEWIFGPHLPVWGRGQPHPIMVRRRWQVRTRHLRVGVRSMAWARLGRVVPGRPSVQILA